MLTHTTALDRLWGGAETLAQQQSDRVYTPRSGLVSGDSSGSEEPLNFLNVLKTLDFLRFFS